MSMSSRLLRAAAPVELISLALLLVNLATVHWQAVASLFGPVHGCAYLFVIGATIHKSRAIGRRGSREPGSREPGSREPGSREPGSREPGSREPGSRGDVSEQSQVEGCIDGGNGSLS